MAIHEGFRIGICPKTEKNVSCHPGGDCYWVGDESKL